jgi:hypothetical protein
MSDELKIDKIKDLVLQHAKDGKVVFRTLDGFASVSLDEFVEQPTEGLLYDLNRDRVTVLSFIDDPKWVNDFAVTLVIEKLKGNLIALRTALAAAQAENARLRAALESVEWVQSPSEIEDDYCPWCLSDKPDHTDTCLRQSALHPSA